MEGRHRFLKHRWMVYLFWLLGGVVGIVVVWLSTAAMVYSPEYVRRVLVWGESDQGDYLHHFPLRELHPSPTPFVFEVDRREGKVRSAFEPALGIADLEGFLAGNGTQAFIVIQNDRVIYEGYFNGATRDSMLTSFSVAKSFDSALVGIAIGEGLIGLDAPITEYLPELEARDPRFAKITVRHVLAMASGLDYRENRWALFNGDDPLTTYFTDQRTLALENTRYATAPAELFQYNKYHPQLLGLILERTTGMSVTAYMQSRLWDPLGMEYEGAWALDSESSGFEKMEAGLNARAIDYIKLGSLFLHGGTWNGRQIVSAEWVHMSTGVDPGQGDPAYYASGYGRDVYADGDGYYALMWYGRTRVDGPSDFYAEGDHGQFIYVSPSRDVVVLRNGTDYGIPPAQWIDAFFAAVSNL